jgi:parallel beta-helix repeat protein
LPNATPDDPGAVFLDGTLATDGEGTEDDPFALLETAIEALEEMIDFTTPTIYIVGTVTLDGVNQINDVSLASAESANAKIMRSYKFNGPLFEVTNASSQVTFSDVIIDGNSANMSGYSSDELISVDTADANVKISKGVVLRNNLGDSGPAIRITEGSVVMDATTGTSANPPLITGNVATGNGGGVAVYGNGEFTLEEGSIENNTANTYGGGVAIGDVSGWSEFEMSGGTISGNTAGFGDAVSLEQDPAYANFYIAPDGNADFEIDGNIYLVENAFVEIGATIANIETDLLLLCEAPADDVEVGHGSGYMIQDPDDLDRFVYDGAGWSFYLDSDYNAVRLISD